MQTKQLPTYFISHGGGPWPYLTDEMSGIHDKLRASLKDIPRQLGETPKAVLVISGHWEENDFAVMSHPRPPMIYDYSGFPEHTYHVKYEAPGSPEVARRVQELIQNAGFVSHLDDQRGFDHGTFVPLVEIYPTANVPVVQLSLRHDYDPRAHLEVGEVLAPLRKEGVLIVGSGLSYHNLRRFGPAAKDISRQFDEWLNKTLTSAPDERKKNLIYWTQAPAARLAHPQEDHLIPLMVAVGAAVNEPAQRIYHEDNFSAAFRFLAFALANVMFAEELKNRFTK